MLRSTGTTLRALQPVWRSSVACVRQQSTAAAAVVAAEPVHTPPPQQQQQQQQPRQSKPLSARLNGAGHEKKSDGTNLAFSQFLNNAQKNKDQKGPNNKNNRNKNNGNNNRRKASGPSDGAVQNTSSRPKHQPQRAGGNTYNNNNNNNQRPRRNNRNNNNNNNRQPRSASVPRAPVNSVTRRVTTFIDKDIDWEAMSGFVDPAAANLGSDATQLDGEQQAAMVAAAEKGEYQAYLDVAKNVQLGQLVKAEALSALVGGNASYNLNQKTVFLNTIAKATGGAAAAQK